jgi:hypothetical protein
MEPARCAVMGFVTASAGVLRLCQRGLSVESSEQEPTVEQDESVRS